VIHLICLGNPMHGDDGFGAAVFRRLSSMNWPLGMRLFDAVAEGGAVRLFRDCRKAIVIDALPPGAGHPGQIMRLADYPADRQGAAAGGGAGIIATARRTVEPLPEIEIVGAVAVRCRPFQPGLSPLIMAAAESVTAMLGRDLGGQYRRAAG
jgi:hydrogenase maturation protease